MDTSKSSAFKTGENVESRVMLMNFFKTGFTDIGVMVKVPSFSFLMVKSPEMVNYSSLMVIVALYVFPRADNANFSVSHTIESNEVVIALHFVF
jgi:hypothetical protein